MTPLVNTKTAAALVDLTAVHLRALRADSRLAGIKAPCVNVGRGRVLLRWNAEDLLPWLQELEEWREAQREAERREQRRQGGGGNRRRPRKGAELSVKQALRELRAGKEAGTR